MRTHPRLFLLSVVLMVWILLVYVVNNPKPLFSRKSLQPFKDIVHRLCERDFFITETHVWDKTAKQYYGISFKKEHDLLGLKCTELADKKLRSEKIRIVAGGAGFPPSEKGTFSVSSEFDKEPFPFLSDYRNPCWEENVQLLGRKSLRRLRCLPYFYIIGAPKSGTTDLWSRLTSHPQIVNPGFKESQWLAWFRFLEKASEGGYGNFRGNSSIRSFVRIFDRAAYEIKTEVEKSNEGIFHPLVTGIGDTSILYDNDFWPILPGNENDDEPRFTNADYMYHICPQCKIIICLRNPIDRIYSDYIFHKSKGYLDNTLTASREDFHIRVTNGIKVYQDCFQRKSIRSCVYNKTISILSFEQGRMRVGIYYIYLKDFLKVFPRNQVFIQRFEDYIENEMASVERVVKFLNLSKLSSADYKKIAKQSVSQRTPKTLPPMLKATRVLLQNFYQPFNVQLTDLLQDKRYMWMD